MPGPTYDALAFDGTPRSGGQRLPSGEQLISSPLAVLAMRRTPTGQVDKVRNWIPGSGKCLRHLDMTHGRGGHWPGAGTFLTSFPEAATYATASAR